MTSGYHVPPRQGEKFCEDGGVAGVLGSVHRTPGQSFPSQASEWLHYPLQPHKVKYRKDGYLWKKRKDGKTTREDHMKLKVQGMEVSKASSTPALAPTFP